MQKHYVSTGETCFLKKIFSLCIVITLLTAMMLTVLMPATAVTVEEATSYSKMISAGAFHCVVLKSDGTVYTWGRNDGGQLGDGTTTNRNTPVKVSGLTGVVVVAAGGGHSVALKSDGTVYTWGANVRGELGDGTTTSKSTPVKVTGLTLFPPLRTIIFEPTSGTVSPTSATTGIDGKLTNLPTPTRSGYTFIGWFTTAIGGTKITPDTIFTTDTKIYAQWEQTTNPPTTEDTPPTTPPNSNPKNNNGAGTPEGNTSVDDKANSSQWVWIAAALIIVAVVAVVIGLFVFKRTKTPNNNLTQPFTQ